MSKLTVRFEVSDGSGDFKTVHGPVKLSRVPQVGESVCLNGPAFGDGHDEDMTYFVVERVTTDLWSVVEHDEGDEVAVVFLAPDPEVEEVPTWRPNCTCVHPPTTTAGDPCPDCDLPRAAKGNRSAGHFR